jgi:hypothetical protein
VVPVGDIWLIVEVFGSFLRCFSGFKAVFPCRRFLVSSFGGPLFLVSPLFQCRWFLFGVGGSCRCRWFLLVSVVPVVVGLVVSCRLIVGRQPKASK